MVVAPSEAPRSPAASLVSITSTATHRHRSRGTNSVWQSAFALFVIVNMVNTSMIPILDREIVPHMGLSCCR